LLGFIACVVVAEHLARRGARFRWHAPAAARAAQAAQACAQATFTVCALPLAVGFVIPVILLAPERGLG
jgi:hypothetical protein